MSLPKSPRIRIIRANSNLGCQAIRVAAISPGSVIIFHFPGTIAEYDQAEICPGRTIALPECCPDCGAGGHLIRWGFYLRWGLTGEAEYRLVIQRVRCKACGRTHALLPDFLHPYRQYVLALLYRVMWLYLLKGHGHGRIHASLPEQGPVYSTIREWIAAFVYGAGVLLLPSLVSSLTALGVEFEPPARQLPAHLKRVSDPVKRQRLEQAVYFWQLAERLYAWVKNRQARLHFAAASLFAFVLHWLQSRARPPRLFWHEALPGTPRAVQF